MLHILLACLCLLTGLQLKVRELRLITRKYNYKPGPAQLPTAIAAVLAIAILLLDTSYAGTDAQLTPLSAILVVVAILIVFAIEEWILSRFSPRCAIVSWLVRLAIVIACAIALPCLCGIERLPLTGFILSGIYLRNTPFGAPHIKDLCLAFAFARKGPYADSHNGVSQAPQSADGVLPAHVVTEFGVVPNLSFDQTGAIQRAIDTIGRQGGGTLYFPKGRYNVNGYGNSFLQINYSNITLEGETDSNGRPLAEIVCQRPTVRGHKNPWLSPFMITTGEQLQPSNEFWGLDFRKKKASFKQSGSLSDPGSDGRILTPPFATTVVKTAKKGATTLTVADSSRVGKYILLGLYNTTPDGNLIRDILGMDHLRPEWTEANRAGSEEAPSYQWLTEVKAVIDSHTIELTRPLPRDCDMCYTPAIYNAEMLERITIRNLQLSSRWNGMFRHHGFPLYYTVRQTQEMDYGWNAICLKRVAHGEISNVEIQGFTNPLYVLDSRDNTVSGVTIGGYDGHQGLKIYCHSCDNVFENITFTAHFADMMGGEGNAYCNVFRDIRYLNPEFNPVDYDFHGCANGAMSAPADNLFTRIYGFRCMKHAGPIANMPAAAQGNTWTDTVTEGERRGEYLFYNMTYRQKRGVLRFITAVGYAIAMRQKRHRLMLRSFVSDVREKLAKIDATGAPRSEHRQYIPQSYVRGIKTWGKSQF